MGRKVNRYFVTIPINSWQDAKLFSSETNWRLLETLRDAGIEGLTVEELAKKTRTPKSTVYSILSKLQAGDWIESETRRFGWGRPKKEVKRRFGGKPARVYIENINWGSAEFDDAFYNTLEPLLDHYKDHLKKHWLAILDEIVSKYETDEELKEFFPKDSIHEDEECGWSHEALEFLAAISLALLEKILGDADIDQLARKYKFRK